MGGAVPLLSDVGEKADNETADYYRREVAHLLNRRQLSFPGAQPVSFCRHHIEELQRTDYLLCEKTDGIRCLLYFTKGDGGNEMHFLIDRKNDYYLVPQLTLHFPLPDQSPTTFHTDTLIDGELVIDALPDGREEKNYLVFDCMMLDNRSYIEKPLDKRIGAFSEFVFKPYDKLLKEYPEEIEHQAFIVKFKAMQKSYGTEMMFRDILPNLPHGNDGLVFTCKDTPYMFGTDQHILKWKPPHENTVDFKLQMGNFPMFDPQDGEQGLIPDYHAMPSFELLVHYERNHDRFFAHLYVTEDEWELLKSLNRQLDGRIIECYKDSTVTPSRWRFKKDKDGTPRFRDDKTDANHISTVNSVLQSIEDSVSERDLIGAASVIAKAWKKRHPEEEQAKKRMAQRTTPGAPNGTSGQPALQRNGTAH
ncbi:mRNA capping enzyme alpha subunit [Cryomyces antarcticus]